MASLRIETRKNINRIAIVVDASARVLVTCLNPIMARPIDFDNDNPQLINETPLFVQNEIDIRDGKVNKIEKAVTLGIKEGDYSQYRKSLS